MGAKQSSQLYLHSRLAALAPSVSALLVALKYFQAIHRLARFKPATQNINKCLMFVPVKPDKMEMLQTC